MNKLSSTLKQLIHEHSLNTTELARLTGILQPVMHRIISGETDNPKIGTLIPIAQYFGISIDQLLGEPPLLNDHDLHAHNYQCIPLLTWKQAKEFPNLLSYNNTILINTNSHSKKNKFALKIKDSTMYPLFLEDTIIIVDADLSPKNKDFAIIEIKKHTEPFFKQVFFDNEDIYLKPLNQDFKSFQIDHENEFRFLGVVVQSITNF